MVPPCSDRISRVPPYSRIFEPLRIRGYHPLWPDFPDCSAYLSKTTGLFRVRSPLLAESLLMSVPPGTEMFQFPGFASSHLCIQCDDTLAGGLPHSDIHGSTPARGSPWLFAACHVLHRLLVPRHPPNALLILDIPDSAAEEPASPCTETILRPCSRPDQVEARARDDPGNIIFSAHNRILSDTSIDRLACARPSPDPSRQDRSQRL